MHGTRHAMWLPNIDTPLNATILWKKYVIKHAMNLLLFVFPCDN